MTILSTFGGTSGVDTGDIGHSLRFRGAQYIATTLTTAATSTYFILFKQAKLGAINPLFDTNIKINANDTITAFGLTTTAVKRDPTGWHWMHVSNNGLVVDGVNLGAVTTSALTNPRIGFDGTNYANMYGARICCVSGSSLAYTDFVTFSSTTNEWVVKTNSAIKALVDAGGSAGFMYEFDDATSLTTLGNDYSSKNNDGTLTGGFSLTAGTTYDHMLDVPGNSYATLNPLDKYSTVTALTNGNLSIPSGVGETRTTVVFPNTGKFYGEMVQSATTNLVATGFGIAKQSVPPTAGGAYATDVWMIYSANQRATVKNGVHAAFLGGNGVGGDFIQFAYDADTGNLWLGLNNQWLDSGTTYTGNPSTGINPTVSGLTSGPYAAMAHVYGVVANVLLGQAPLHASATYHADAGGYFRYAPPDGFKALCQANLPTPAILNPSSAVAHRFEAGSGIAAAIASDRSGWSDWMEWFKRTDTTESWKVRFSDDSGNMMAFDTNGAKAAWSAPSAGTYLGTAFKVGATYGVVTGTYSGDSTSNKNISHSLGKAPTCGIVKNESTGTWYVWHTKMTSVAYFTTLNSATPPAQSNTNTPWGTGNWSSTQFMVTNNATNNLNATGSTYRYILFADIDGLLALLGHTGNASTDGAFEYAGHKTQLLVEKDLSATTGFYLWSDKIDTYNVTASYLLLNTNAGTAAATGVDVCSNGTKYRSATIANAANPHMGISYSRTHGKYSLGR